jgi:hypothetical protein
MTTMNIASLADATAMEEGRIPAEIVAVIAAAAAAFVGRRIHIRWIEPLHSEGEQVSRWSRQGRVLVQSSHNLPVKH